ncbi:hypothetical protein [Streptomyces sp. S.PB5]|uniref:hypothetical protein n=1 Tax=Streptomyces sp. S.PB5 TaxID=3020844 RepID=UPI0025B1E0F5|nr:hypothetical protein [Streptomyces sp. S.PB5]MDN3029717.1 hypothetical protein [Streptomyces sp. S.PB5]
MGHELECLVPGVVVEQTHPLWPPLDPIPLCRSHEHACVRCSLLRPDPAQRGRLVEIRDNLIDRITEAEQQGWPGEIEGLRVSLSGAESKINQIDTTAGSGPVLLGTPAQR